MRPIVAAALIGALAVAEPRLATGQAPVPPNKVRSYTLLEARQVEPPGRGTMYRYADTPRLRLDVYVYAIDAATEADSAARVAHALRREVAAFKEVLPVGQQRGWYDAYRIAYEQSSDFTVGRATVPGFTIAYAFRQRGAMYVSFYYVHAVGAYFLKTRATVPEAEYRTSDVPLFVQELIRLVVKPT